MSSYRKKKGLYPRDKGFRKDDRFIIVACDDTHAPYQYFGFFELPRVRLLILPPHATKSAARHVLDNLLDYAEEDYDERWLLLDVDHYDQGRHVAGYVATIREAQNKGIRVAISKPCFEVWLLLHYLDESAIESMADCNAVVGSLRSVLGSYNKTLLRPEHFPIARVKEAIRRSRQLDQGEYKVPTANTTRVCQLWESIISKMDSWERFVLESRSP